MTMKPQRLRATIALAQEGSTEGYSQLLDAYGSRLYGYFYRATRNRHEAEDLLGDLMLRLVKRLKSYEDRGRFEQWLFRVAANMVRDYIRRQKVNRSARSLYGKDENSDALADRLPEAVEPIGAAMEASEISEQIDTALMKLDPTVRHMILLRHFSEMSFKEIAEIFACPLGTVLAKVHRGLRKLREFMVEDDHAR